MTSVSADYIHTLEAARNLLDRVLEDQHPEPVDVQVGLLAAVVACAEALGDLVFIQGGK